MGVFTVSASAGFIMLISTLIACLFTRNKVIQLIDAVFKDKSQMKKIKGWMFEVASFVLMIVTVGCSPTGESSDIQVADSLV